MVNPGGTGRPAFVISARPAPLPPSSARIFALPSALPPANRYTHFWAFAFGAALVAFFARVDGMVHLPWLQDGYWQISCFCDLPMLEVVARVRKPQI